MKRRRLFYSMAKRMGCVSAQELAKLILEAEARQGPDRWLDGGDDPLGQALNKMQPPGQHRGRGRGNA